MDAVQSCCWFESFKVAPIEIIVNFTPSTRVENMGLRTPEVSGSRRGQELEKIEPFRPSFEVFYEFHF